MKLYYRKSLFDKSELMAAEKYFDCTPLLSEIKPGDFVVSRYGLWPFYKDQEMEINNLGGKLINSYYQYNYIADLKNWYNDLYSMTPQTWFRLEDIPDNGPFVLKGQTNSKKNFWNKMMFAKDKKAASEVHSRLCEDGLISEQNIYIRQYIPLVTYFTGIGGVPITKEFRFFVAFGEIISGGYYWQNYSDEFEKLPSIDDVPKSFLETVIKKVGDKSNFYVIDVAQTVNGDWVVIELNEGQASGLSENDPNTLYKNLKLTIDRKLAR